MIRRLGRKAVKTDTRTLRLAKYLSPELPAPPPALDWTERFDDPFGMMLNDSIGDCTIAGAGHAVQTWTRNADGRAITVSDADILHAYEVWCGYNPADPNTDRGGIELDILNLWRKRSLAGHQLYAYASVNQTSLLEVRTAIKLFGGVYIGISLPNSAQGQKVWDVVNDTEDSAPGSWGGHCVWVPTYDPHSFTCITWGERLKMTTAFWSRYVDESYCLFAKDWINSGGIAPSGFGVNALTVDLERIH